MNRCHGGEEVLSNDLYDCDLLGTNIAPTSLDSSVVGWAEAEWIPRDGPFAFLLNGLFTLLLKFLEPFLLQNWGRSIPANRGMIQMAFPLLLSTNYPSSWKVDVGQGHGGRMTLLLMRPWRNCNAIDEDGRAWYDDSNLAKFVWLSTSVAPMSRVTALASPSHLCA
ncbi:unnamed protein product [Prunus brigantina]